MESEDPCIGLYTGTASACLFLGGEIEGLEELASTKAKREQGRRDLITKEATCGDLEIMRLSSTGLDLVLIGTFVGTHDESIIDL